MEKRSERVGDKFNLPNGWINSDFVYTNSFSDRLDEFSVYYKTFCGVLNVRSIKAQYLIAMKLRSGRKFKNDLSDIIGILSEHKKNGDSIEKTCIDKAIIDLYGSWDDIDINFRQFIDNTFEYENLDELYLSTRNDEINTKDILLEFDNNYPKVIKESNINDIIELLKKKSHILKNKIYK